MTSSPTRRRFLPEPVETTSRSLRHSNRDPEIQLADKRSDQNSTSSYSFERRSHDQMKPAATTRRLLPQPIETSSKHSQDTRVHEKEGREKVDKNVKEHARESPDNNSKFGNKPRRFTPQPVETTIKSSRKFAAEPVETTTRSSRRKKGKEPDEEEPQTIQRRFAPQPIETSTKCHRRHPAEESDEAEVPQTRRRFIPAPIEFSTSGNRKKQAETQEEPQSQPYRRKFAPEPIETTVRRRRKHSREQEADSQSSDENFTSRRSSDGILGTRKFSPELIETARGSFRRGDGSPRISGSRKTDHPTAVPGYLRPPLAPSNSPCHSSEEVPQIQESRFSAACLARRQTRQHSFIVPELPCIESDSSEENSGVPSLSTSPSASSDESTNRQSKANNGESRGGKFQGYLLSLAAQAAEKQLMDQAMAAYPNEQIHEPVHHFAVEDSDEESLSGKLEADKGIDPKTFRRESAADLDWHMKEMRRHHEQLEEAKRALKEDTAGQSRFSAAALSTRHKTQAKKVVGGNQKGVGLAEMRNAASPPMLGENLVFPMSVSPKMTRCDVDQIPVPRTHERDDGEDETGEPQLWNPNVGVSDSAGAGLWMGFCQKKDCDAQSPCAPLRSGLMTPTIENDDLEEAQDLRHGRRQDKLGHNFLQLPPTPNSQNDTFTDSIDEKLNKELSIEQQIEVEFNNGFVTQIYNYLSLGYPSLAHSFDHELSKISRVSVEELRKDDDLADAKGYVGAPEGRGLDEDSVRDGKCVRWTALRLYIHEWARQQPDMADRKPDEWGVRARRGSWAF